MEKLGCSIIAIISFIVIVFSFYYMVTPIGVPFLMKLAYIGVAIGIVLILIKQLGDKKKEKKEQDDYKDY